ncbi:MAG: dockerin type I domain-containing protein [Phycisphaerales bacterium]|nr:dockerin type I domain-containing protein [Phycisphaerales bacterium]
MSHRTVLQNACLGFGVSIAILSPGLAGENEIGPDVVGFYIADSINYLGSVDGTGGYAFGTTSCNYGDMEADWYGGTNNTPMIAQNAYRLKNGRFEQIGTSWLKHSFCALSEGGCGDCQATDCNTLGIGCADTYGAGLNTNPSGPRSDINAFTGYYDYPFSISPSGPAAIRGNLCIANDDVDPALNEGARYFFEGYYVCTDEAPWGTQFNNGSWREIEFDGISSLTAIGSTNVAQRAIDVWQQIDPSVTLSEVMVPEDGMVVVGSKVTELSNGIFRYEYAVYNVNCDQSVGGVSIDMPAGVEPTNVGFHDVDYHSGESWDSTDWTPQSSTGLLRWSTTPYGQNPMANAIRWHSLYNFRFDLPVPPVDGELTLELFKPGAVSAIQVAGPVPGGDPVDPCDLPLPYCPVDIDGSSTVDVSDVLLVIEAYLDCGDGTYRPAADVNGDCCVNVNDILEIIESWGLECVKPGACCLFSGDCVQATPASCEQSGGSFSGPGMPCFDVSCPVPGACCLNETECVVEHEDDCELQNGEFRGYGTDCDTIDCSQSEYNDDCEEAWLIGSGSTDFSTMNATTDGEAHEGCEFDGQTYNDIWFRYSANCSGLLTVSTCNIASYDSDLVVYEGWNCDSLALLGCNDDGPGCEGYTSYLELDVTTGQQIMIRVGGWNEGDAGTGTLQVECESND